MQPNGYQYPPPPPPPPQQNPYAFLYETPKKQSPLSGLKGGSTKKRLFVVLVGLAILVILAFGLKTLLSSSSVDTNSLYAVMGEQIELAGLANTATQDTQNQQYLNLTYTVLATVTNDKNSLTSLLGSSGIKLNPKLFIVQPSADQQLTQAQQTDNFDSTYISVMKQQLELYQKELANAYSKNKSAVLKNYLKTDYSNSILLLKMLGSTTG